MVTTAQRPPVQSPPRRLFARGLRLAGWTLISAGSVVLLYVAYLLVFTNVTTERAQARLLEDWERAAAAPAPAEADDGEEPVDDPVVTEEPGGTATPDGTATPAGAPDGAVALLEFHRPGSDEPPVRDDPVLVVDGVGGEDLRDGPGHYPGTAPPGGPGNFAVAGHRTTYGAPFFHLDELEPGDEVHVTDRGSRRHVYRVVSSAVVSPADVWVLGGDPLGSGRPTLTLTTCHPRFSAARRLVVFAELVG